MATSNVSGLYEAVCNGEIETVKRLLPTMSLETLNRLESNGDTCLHAATSRGYRDIIRLLLTRGAYRCVRNRNGRTPLEETNSKYMAELFARPAAEATIRFSGNPTRQPEWQFEDDSAEAYSRAINWGALKDRGIKKTIEKIHKYRIIENNGDPSNEIVLNHFKDALKNKDPISLLKAYTSESQFYKQLNRDMATGNRREVFDKLRRRWTGYYTGLIVRNPAFEPLRFTGEIYRGMQITESEYSQYTLGTAYANKSFQSASKSWKIAKGFAYPSQPTPGRLPIILVFTILDRKSAINIETISDFPNEEEVLIVPGTLFIVADINRDEVPHEIELRQIEWENEL